MADPEEAFELSFCEKERQVNFGNQLSLGFCPTSIVVNCGYCAYLAMTRWSPPSHTADIG